MSLRSSVDGGHESLLNSELVVEDLGERSEAVCGARSVGDWEVVCISFPSLCVNVPNKLSVYLLTSSLGSYLSKLTPHTNMGASAEGAEMTTFLAPPFK